ncbi:MAG TPA: trimeric intracellular cation channel family protein [Chitinophagaceae bacterium]|nr:trimeric intracellular cation channel family protein [Chitinophagaceae bacterium]
MDYLKLVDILGTAAFAVSGVLAAIEKKLDLFGVFVIAFVTAMGGGTLRDVLIGDVPVSWMRHPEYGLIIFISAVVAMLFTNIINNFQKTLLVFDGLGLGFFTVFGLQKGLALGLHPAICILLGTITACFGGVIRDILLNTIPLLFRKKEIYATACIFGGVVYFLLLGTGLSNLPADIICIAVIVIIRLVALKYNWSLPTIHSKSKTDGNT